MFDSSQPNLTLASASPRRRELLAQLGWEFDVLPAEINEAVDENEPPSAYVRRLAIEKALAVADQIMVFDVHIVMGSDTAVVIENEVLSKPKDKQNACEMLEKLSGRKHQVLTGLCIAVIPSGHSLQIQQLETMSRQLGFEIQFEECALGGLTVFCASCVVATDVLFKPLTSSEIENYCESGEPYGKAGAYAIQGYAGAFVQSLRGSFSAVVGLPLFETNELIKLCVACLINSASS